jgi:hypothetical protein
MPRHSATPLLLVLAACDSDPTLLVTNATGRPLEIEAYDYTAPANGPRGIVFSPSFELGRVNSASACLTLANLMVADEFALAAYDTLTSVQFPTAGTFVPKNAPGWGVTIDTFPVILGVLHPSPPVAMSQACTP